MDLSIFHSIEFYNIMEKTLTLTNIKAKFRKDFDTFGKMVKHFLRRIPTWSSKLALLLLRPKSQKVWLL